MAKQISEETKVTIDLKTIGIVVAGIFALATMWFTLQADIALAKELPEPVIPLPTPQAEFLYPRVLEDYDFGVAPIKGAKAVGGSWLTVASSAIGSVAKIGLKQGWGED